MKLRLKHGVLVNCPKCGQSCSGGRGLATHLQKHGITKLTEALKKQALESSTGTQPSLTRTSNAKPGTQVGQKSSAITPKPKRAYVRKKQENNTQNHTLRFHYCPACGVPISEMEDLIMAGHRIQNNA